MRIAVFLDRLAELGGLESHVINSSRELIRRGHEVGIIAGAASPLLLNLIAKQDKLFSSTWQQKPIPGLFEFNPDIIHAHPFSAIGHAVTAAQELGKPLVVTMHGLYNIGFDSSPIGTRNSNLVKRLIAVDLAVGSILLNSTSFPDKVTIIRNGIDLDVFTPMPSADRDAYTKLGLNPDYKTLLLFSRLQDNKELVAYQLIACAPALAERLGGLNLLILGGGAWFSAVKERGDTAVKDCPLLNFHAAGSQLDVIPYLQLADLVIACGRSALESMACQRPLLAACHMGFAGPVTMDTHNDYLFLYRGYKWEENDQLTEQLAATLTNPGLLQQMAGEGRRLVQRYYDLRLIIDQLERTYNSVLMK